MEDQWKLVPEELNFPPGRKSVTRVSDTGSHHSCSRRIKQRRQRCRQWDDDEADCGGLNVGSR